jgi:hypothetical protein
MFFADRLTFGQIQKSSDGYMKVRCRSGRAGIYQYLGREVDPEGKHFAADQVVNVYRSPEEVFDQQHLASFVGKPITIDHPAEPVTAGNWRTHAAGMIMGAVRDGEHIGFDLAFMDSASIQTVEAGKRERLCQQDRNRRRRGTGWPEVSGPPSRDEGQPLRGSRSGPGGRHLSHR